MELRPREPRKPRRRPELRLDIYINEEPPRRSRRHTSRTPLTPNIHSSQRDRYSDDHSSYPKTPVGYWYPWPPRNPRSPRHAKSPRRARPPRYAWPAASRPQSPGVPADHFYPTPHQYGFGYGSHYPSENPNDTCREKLCTKPSRVWGGFCDWHGCAAGTCRRKREAAMVYIPDARGGRADMRPVSRYCYWHSCMEPGCEIMDPKGLGICAMHLDDGVSYIC
ncbi:uncharacterized protein DNG_03321 [Cephalotrichum gorgonifer]|uniref:Uncharacterized protein n=1 Tax=Cephalotrichum gorgonifer TaxID=2041049 RepID=A0AAE8MU10_9PEZI|nr:uncharacterized protein DNG_03321 [Cephalotrichum gorgonifer]